jgi:hypothetical protein
LFGEYEKSLKNFGVHPAPLPANLGISDFIEWIDTEFKALPEVISGASDFAAVFSIESILKLLHDFDCADLVKFLKKLPQFPDASRTSRLRPNEDVLAIKTKFSREFSITSGKEAVKKIARPSSNRLIYEKHRLFYGFTKSYLLVFLTFLSLLTLGARRGETRKGCCISRILFRR